MRFRLHLAVPAVALLQMASAFPLASQDSEDFLDEIRRTVVVDSVAALGEGRYVVPDTGRMNAEHLRDRQRAGAYAGAATRSALAKALTTDLQALNGDWHLHLKHDPKLAAAWARRLEQGSGGGTSLSVYWSNTGETVVRRTPDEVPGPRRTEVPLFVLVDRGSGSAAEDVPFVLQNLGRATMVGETTAGAGRNNAYFPAGKGMAASISISRVTEPGTGREWEGVGVVPDIVTSSDEALSAAHAAALEKLGRAPSPMTDPS